MAAGAVALDSRASAATLGSGRIPIGLNTYCLRAMRWNDFQLIDYAAGLKLDAVFLQDSLDPDRNSLEHWKKVRSYAADKGLHLEVAILGAVLPKSPDGFEESRKMLLHGVAVSAAAGSPIVRCLHASDRAHLPPGSIEQHMDTMIKLLKSVRSQAMDAGVKFAIENHKDLLAWEMRHVMEGAGTEFVGSYLDTGNPVFVCENPATTVEVLGPVALTFHLRDSAVYETPQGAAVQWVPLGEGNVDFKKLIARMREIAKPLYIYIKPITGRPPAIMPYLEQQYWQNYQDMRAADFAKFLDLAKNGHPYEGHQVMEDIPGRALPEPFVAAMQYQQREHMERSVEYAKKVLDLGVRWRS